MLNVVFSRCRSFSFTLTLGQRCVTLLRKLRVNQCPGPKRWFFLFITSLFGYHLFECIYLQCILVLYWYIHNTTKPIQEIFIPGTFKYLYITPAQNGDKHWVTYFTKFVRNNVELLFFAFFHNSGKFCEINFYSFKSELRIISLPRNWNNA